MSTPDRTTILRVLSYNIHGCMGSDRVVNLRRIADVISEINADLIALQEVDVEKSAGGSRTQAETIGEILDLRSIYFPLEQKGRHFYGLAVLSRFPITDVHFLRLPNLFQMIGTRKRGALYVTLHTPVGPMHLINTHLSVFKVERRRQLNSLLSEWYPEKEPIDVPLIFCGDLNAGPSSHTYQTLAERLVDVQLVSKEAALQQGTFHARSPVFRIDHIFVSHHLTPLRVEIKRTSLTTAASDHLPLIAELAS